MGKGTSRDRIRRPRRPRVLRGAQSERDHTRSGGVRVRRGHCGALPSPKIETKNGIVYVNPGSAGPHRFKLPVAVATLAIAGSVILPRILEIAPYRKKSRVSHEEIATFNVNRVNRRLPVLLRWLGEAQPDIVCLQELKASQEKFPISAIRAAGYGAIWQGQKSWN